MSNTRKLLLVMSIMYSVSVVNAETGGVTIPNAINNTPLPPAVQLDPNAQSNSQQTTNQQAAQANSQGSGLVSGGLGQAFGAEGAQPQASSDTGTNDRKNNLNQSSNMANAGSAAAGTAGGILTGLGVPMLLSPDIPTQVAGAILLADAAQEFAQMGASGNAGNQNNNLAKTISSPNGDGSQATGSTPSAPQLDQQTKDALQAAGIDPNQLAQDLANGANAQDLLGKYAGNPTVTPDQQSAADAQVASALESLPNGIDPSKALTMDDSNKIQTVGVGGPKSIGGNPPESSVGEGAQANAEAAAAAAARLGAQTSTAANPLAAELNLSGLNDTAIKGWVMQMQPPPVTDMEARGFLTGELGQVGVSVVPKGENIFQRAHHQYRNYGRWRQQERIAKN